MEFIDICRTREAVRSYKSLPVETEKIERIVEAVRLAPSACNFQPWKFFILKSEEAMKQAASFYDRDWFKTAPMAIVCCIDHSQEWVRPADAKKHGIIDIAIAAEHICLAAAEVGLGTCWVCNFDVAKCSEVLGLGSELEPAVLIPMGYPSTETPREKSRKPVEDIIEFR